MKKAVAMINKITKLYLKYKEIILYIIVGALTTFISIFSYLLFRLVIDNYKINTILSWIIAVSFAYIANRKIVFLSKKTNIFKEFVTFIYFRILSLILEFLCMYLLVEFIIIDDRISKILVQFIILTTNYIFSKLFIFKKTKVK